MTEELKYDRLWDEEIFLEDGPRTLRVQSTRDAYLLLRNYWNVGEGASRDKALAICKTVLSENASPDKAREAFITAARDAGIKVNSWTS
ncbi:hypothetical protein LPJGGPFB_05150 [Ensifer adhaerens]|uniref:DUF982 domain-containing protein n=1 Tax=Ensifer adhaerens TaxID=106592 RepID=UPI001569DA45|nr:DUF982 domain-containing protein [Ensifer adhaerens]NRP21891.1 hypothetical protein [Ensifer adhaerens]